MNATTVSNALQVRLSQLPQHAREQFLRRGVHAAAQHVEQNRARLEPLCCLEHFCTACLVGVSRQACVVEQFELIRRLVLERFKILLATRLAGASRIEDQDQLPIQVARLEDGFSADADFD